MTGTKIAAFIGFGMIVLGAFLPWAQVGALKANGTDGDGVLTLILGLAGAALVYFWNRHKALPLAAVVAAGLALLIGGYDTINIADTDPIFGEFGGEVDVGTGLYLTIIGALVAGVTALVEAAQQRKKVSPQVDEQDNRKAA